MNESGVWAQLKEKMKFTGWHAVRIESSSGNGVPDVTYGLQDINGWIELKYIKEWPKRATTLVKLPLRPEQKFFFQKRGELSGNVWCFIRIQDTFFLLSYKEALEAAYHGWTKDEWLQRQWWHGTYKGVDVLTQLQGGC